MPPLKIWYMAVYILVSQIDIFENEKTLLPKGERLGVRADAILFFDVNIFDEIKCNLSSYKRYWRRKRG